MSILIVGISHHTAPVSVLDRVAPAGDTVAKLLLDASTSPHVREAVLLATCNRVEIYAEVERFHGGIEGLAELLARHSGTSLTGLIPHLYVRYEEAAVSHLLGVACGLDSMVVGESQILGQVKAALRTAQDQETIGPELNSLFQRALRVGKRAHTETGIGRAGQSVVSVALERVHATGIDLATAIVVVVGAGSMAALAATTLNRDFGIAPVIANRTADRAARLAASLGGRTIGLDGLDAELAAADLVVSCTGALGAMITADAVAVTMRTRLERPLVVVDLALPRDVEPAVAGIDGVTLIDLSALADTLRDDVHGREVEAACAIIADEVDRFVAATRAAAVTPTVVALRTRAAELVDDELRRLDQRLPALADAERAEVQKTVRRVVDKLLHTPTIRVKELAEHTVETSYAEALRKLFALDPATVDQVTQPELPGTHGGAS